MVRPLRMLAACAAQPSVDPVGRAPEQFAQFLPGGSAQWATVINTAAVQAER